MVKATNQNVEGLCIGLNKGFVVKRVEKVRSKPANMKRSSKRMTLVRNIVKKIAGLNPYEKKALEMFKTGVSRVEARGFRLIKRRLGSMRRAKRKSEELYSCLLYTSPSPRD